MYNQMSTPLTNELRQRGGLVQNQLTFEEREENAFCSNKGLVLPLHHKSKIPRANTQGCVGTIGTATAELITPPPQNLKSPP